MCPWISEPTFRLGSGLGLPCPAASLLGLPAELRQKVLSSVLDVRALVETTAKSMAAPKQRDSCAEAVGSVVASLSCVSPLVRCDMTHVRKVWRRQLDAVLVEAGSRGAGGPAQRRAVQDEDEDKTLAVSAGVGQWSKSEGRRKGGLVLEAKEVAQCQGRRQKCWRCGERHGAGDEVCAMARRQPERWMRLTKAVPRPREAASCWGQRAGAKKMRFDD